MRMSVVLLEHQAPMSRTMHVYGQIAVVLCESNFARLSPLPPLSSSSSSRRRRRRRRRSSQAAALCFQLWPVWASLIQPTRPLAGSI